ncbi:class I SAM-dependent methyltransferase [Pseudoalteromonas sp. SMS1]|uniref:class I SAM-dependent methyltransferase n=1 Tax=Pseudoalteromonas sp. SMS1 TaxID=2908894 RepID=UPI001F42B565|nr:class I SAM-dependent methyltransferase [Pseudoalteromonas sp. SMS1]MCF2859167.1 class I SAM-dependent methyltransferase [Pseudoalteromonas sp. SMS1]
MVSGTQGYEKVVDAFATASFNLKFEEINQDFLSLLPTRPARVLDAGSGVGQNAAALAQLGYDVVAVEPLQLFLSKAVSQYPSLKVQWLNDSLPELANVSVKEGSFDFVLLDGVWHHLNLCERRRCIERLASLMSEGAICAISLRHGPAGAGTHVYPTRSSELLDYANEFGFVVVLNLENQPSKMPNKAQVTWSRVALKKR